MAKLKTRHKEFIIKQLACFEAPKEIVSQLKNHFGITVSYAQVTYYNPDSSQGSRELARKWRHLFYETRERFIEESSQIPIAHKNYRLRELQKIYQKLIRVGNLSEACRVLEQAAKEMGGVYNGKQDTTRTHEGSDFYQQVNQRIIQLSKN